MNEATLNTIIGRSVRRLGYTYHKMSDESSDQKPFDGFGVLNNKPLYVESKLIKKGMYSFNFNKIEGHQYENLKNITDSLDLEIPDKFYTLYAIGFFKPRDFFRILFFNHKTIEYLKLKGKESILKKELEDYINRGLFLEICYEKVHFGNKEKRIQYVNGLEKIDEVII